MFSEDECLNDAHNVLFVFRIIGLQLLEHASLDEALLVETLLVAKNFERDYFLFLVIEALEYLTKRTFSDAFLHFVTIGDMVVNLADILALVVIEASILGAVWRRESFRVILTLEDVQVVDLVVFKDLSLFIVKQVLAEVHDDVSRLHRELYLERPLLIIAKECLASDGGVRLNAAV